MWLLLSIAWSLEVGVCHRDFYDESRAVKETMCQPIETEDNQREPASASVNPSPMNDIHPTWNEEQVKAYMALKSGSFNNYSFTEKGSKNIIITKLQNGQRKVSLSYKGDGKFQQISVFDRNGKLIAERIDTDMDGHVDQVYECKHQTCERQYNIVNGKPQKLVRNIASGPNETIEVYEDKQGKLTLIKTATQKRPLFQNQSTETEAGFCFECYDKNYNVFTSLLEQFKGKQKRKPKNLPKIDDFYVSRVGVLIHEECFEKFDFDVEKAVTDAIVKGFSCQVDLTEKVGLSEKPQTYYSHIPRLVNLFTNSRRAEGIELMDVNTNKTVTMKDPCREYKTILSSYVPYMDVNRNCSYVPEVELGKPKIICQMDQTKKAVIAVDGEGDITHRVAYASSPQGSIPVIVNWKNKTKMYNSPVISFDPNSSSNQHEGTFKATLWHELMHNCGYAHDSKNVTQEHPDYAWFCEVACFKDEYPEEKRNSLRMGVGDTERECVGDQRGRYHNSFLRIINNILSP